MVSRPAARQATRAALLLALATACALAFWAATRTSGAAGARPPLRVLADSSFLNDWGPGPDLARAFEVQSGIRVEFLDAGDAGLLVTKLTAVPADAAVGLDQFSLEAARRAVGWRLSARPPTEPSGRFAEPGFAAFDWSPISFVYRTSDVRPPLALDDLADSRFRRAIALPDPRLSTCGLQFLFWVLDQKGVDPGFDFLRRLAENVLVAPSWSAAYGLFQKREAKLGLGYWSSPVYHLTQENDPGYAVAQFPAGHPVQVEYAGVPVTCRACAEAEAFVAWLSRPAAQKLIMAKNYMLPIDDGVTAGTPFASLPPFKVLRLASAAALLKRRDELLARWSRLGL